MNYGYFDDDAKEYVITRPDTPTSWSNYLGSTEYGAIITNNAGGYGFYKSGAQGRFLRLRFNSVPMDQPGTLLLPARSRERGLLVRLLAAGGQTAGTATSPPAGTAPPIRSIKSDYAGISTETTYFVPLGQTFEYWRLKVTTTQTARRELSVFTLLRVHQPVDHLPGPGQPAVFVVHRQRRTGWMTCCASPSTIT